MISHAVSEFLSGLLPKENIRFNEPLKDYCSFQVGGPADCVALVDTHDQLTRLISFLRKTENDFIVLGNGTNILISDNGYRGVVIRLGKGMSRVHIQDEHVYAQAGAKLGIVSRMAMEKGLSGLEFGSGIPGTIGGAVVMNAGAYGGEMSRVVESVTVINSQGELMDLENRTMEFGYRTSAIKDRPFVVTEVSFVLKPKDRSVIESAMKKQDELRRQKQPLEYPSAGSTFKRPEGHFAGKLIMDAGLAGMKIGGAMVSEKHCGFIINAGGATAQDIASLMLIVQNEVRSRFKVMLEPEVVLLGDFEEKPYIV